MKTELTKQQRHEVYKLAHSRIVNKDNSLMCFAISRALQQLMPDLPWGDDVLPTKHPLCPFDSPECYPEFLMYKPAEKDSGESWFPCEDQESRIKILEACVEETREVLNETTPLCAPGHRSRLFISDFKRSRAKLLDWLV